MTENFTEQALGAIAIAESEACPDGPSAVNPEHILIGLLRIDLQLFEVVLPSQPDSITHLNRWIEPFTPTSRKNWTWSEGGGPFFSTATEEVIQFANNSSNTFGHEFVGTEHLLLGLLNSGYKCEPPTSTPTGHSLLSIKEVLNQYGYFADDVIARIKDGTVSPQNTRQRNSNVLVALPSNE